MSTEALASHSPTLEWRVEEASRRLDLFLLGRGLFHSRSGIQRLVREGKVTINGRAARASTPLKPGDWVRAEQPSPEPSSLQPEAIPLTVVFEDQDVAVIDKPAGVAVHPGAGRPNGTLANALLARWPGLASSGDAQRPGIVHRLDKDTSGLMVVAKNEASYLDLSCQIKEQKLQKGYLALAVGELKPGKGRIEGPIGRDPRNRRRMAVVEGGRPAFTEYRVLEYLPGHSLIEVTPITGRTHQIRVHLAAIGYPLLGDRLYGGGSPLLGRQFLHAFRLGFRLPTTGEYREFASPLAPELEGVLEKLREAKDAG